MYYIWKHQYLHTKHLIVHITYSIPYTAHSHRILSTPFHVPHALFCALHTTVNNAYSIHNTAMHTPILHMGHFILHKSLYHTPYHIMHTTYSVHHTSHCTLHTVLHAHFLVHRCTLHTSFFTPYTPYCTHYTFHTSYCIKHTLHTAHTILSILSILHSSHHTLQHTNSHYRHYFNHRQIEIISSSHSPPRPHVFRYESIVYSVHFHYLCRCEIW